jgi:hypothetical protein
VRGVWRAVADACRWVAGVAGNHDSFGDARALNLLRSSPGRTHTFSTAKF